MFRKILSTLLVAPIGCLIGTLFGQVCTFWVYGIGSWITGPLGIVLGALFGWRISLREAVLIFVGCFGAMAIANDLLMHITIDDRSGLAFILQIVHYLADRMSRVYFPLPTGSESVVI